MAHAPRLSYWQLTLRFSRRELVFAPPILPWLCLPPHDLINVSSKQSPWSLAWEFFPLASAHRKEGSLWVCLLSYFIACTGTWNTLASSGRHLGSLTHPQAPFWSLCSAVTGIVYSKAPSSRPEPQLPSFSVHIFTLLFERNKDVPWSLRTNFPVWASWEHVFWVHTVQYLALTKQLLNKDNGNH